jgi:hypothetical protein
MCARAIEGECNVVRADRSEKSRMSRAKKTGLAAALVAMAAARSAYAHGDVDVDRPTTEPSEPRGRGASGPGYGDGEHVELAEHEEPRHVLALDLVLGWGKVPFAVQNLPGAGNPAITYSRSDQTESNVQSFVLVGAVEVTEHVGVGLRVPFTFAGFSPDGSASRGTDAFGNVELEGEYTLGLGRNLRLVGALGVALPTAQGQAIPVGLSQQNAAYVDETAYDRWSLSRAAAFARGYEDNALFEPQRLGIIPQVRLSYRFRGLSIEPWVKVENLIGTSTLLDASYVGELVGGLRVGYWVREQFEVALKGWVNVGYAGADEDKTTAASLEPQLVLRFGPVRPFAGVIVPLAGPPSDNGFIGVRLGATGSF